MPNENETKNLSEVAYLARCAAIGELSAAYTCGKPARVPSFCEVKLPKECDNWNAEMEQLFHDTVIAYMRDHEAEFRDNHAKVQAYRENVLAEMGTPGGPLHYEPVHREGLTPPLTKDGKHDVDADVKALCEAANLLSEVSHLNGWMTPDLLQRIRDFLADINFGALEG